MTVFYAYMQNIRDTNGWRWLLTFANQETSNEWWRAIQDLASKGKTGYKDVQRHAVQMYSYDTNTLDLAATIQINFPLVSFAGRVFYTLVPDSGGGGSPKTLLPAPAHRDPISGERFFIRSKATPHVYWVKHPVDNTIVASQSARTAFKIERADTSERDHSTGVSNVMVDDDDIYIILGLKLGSYVSNGSDNFLSIAGRGYAYKFGDFKRGFAAWDTTTSGAANWSESGDNIAPEKCKIRVLSSENSGYGWELV